MDLKNKLGKSIYSRIYLYNNRYFGSSGRNDDNFEVLYDA